MNLNLMWKSSCHIWCTSMVVSFKDPLTVLQVSWSWEALATLLMHLNVFSPLWFLSWIVLWKIICDFNGCFLHGSSDGTFKYFDPEKLLPHFVQLNGFSPVWFPSSIFTWCGKAPVTFVALQWLFPSRILWLYFKSLDHENLLPHSVQLNGFSSL